HIVGPVLRPSLPAVVDDVADALFSHLIHAYGVLIAVQVFLEIILDEAAIEFVHFEASRLRGSRVIGDALQRVPEPQHHPPPLLWSPIKRAVSTDLRG